MSLIRFTNKIQSTSQGWQILLLKTAYTFAKFEGQAFDRKRIVAEFQNLSDRLSGSRDESDFRDQYGAYGQFLGLMWVNNNKVSITQTCRELLLSDTPDVPLFVLLQLLTYQVPNGIGAHAGADGKIRLEHLSAKQRRAAIHGRVELAPFRQVLQTLLALQDLDDGASAYVTREECANVILKIPLRSFDYAQVAHFVLKRRLQGVTGKFDTNSFRNFHILAQTGLVECTKSKYSVILPLNQTMKDRWAIVRSFQARYSGFDYIDGSESPEELDAKILRALCDHPWGEYFDGLVHLGDSQFQLMISDEEVISPASNLVRLRPYLAPSNDPTYTTYKLSADPEEIRRLKERSAITHARTETTLAKYLHRRGFSVQQSKLIDVLAHQSKYVIFEVKSISETNFIAQSRKGLSQLHEYRFRHNLPEDSGKVLILSQEPQELPEWYDPFVSNDQKIAVGWFSNDGGINFLPAGVPLAKELQLV